MPVNVKIKLIRTLPVDDVLKCVEGAEFDARYVSTYVNIDGIEVQESVRDNPVEFEAENGETVRAFSHEYEINSK